MKRNARLILRIVRAVQRQPIPIEEIAKRAKVTRRTANSHLRALEKAHLLTVDRSERPYAYELSVEAYIALRYEECRVRQF